MTIFSIVYSFFCQEKSFESISSKEEIVTCKTSIDKNKRPVKMIGIMLRIP